MARPDPRTLLLHRSDLDPVAWQVLLRDGHLVLLRPDVALPAGVEADARARAAALAPLVPRPFVVARETAAWVHLGGPATGPAHVVAPAGVRAPDPLAGRTGAESDVGAADVELLGGVAVTTPRRTALDLLLLAPHDVARELVRALDAARLVDLDRVRTDVALAAGRRGVRGAARVLADVRGTTGVRARAA